MCIYVFVFNTETHTQTHNLQVVALSPNSFSFYLTSVMHSQLYLTVLQRKQDGPALFIHSFVQCIPWGYGMLSPLGQTENKMSSRTSQATVVVSP